MENIQNDMAAGARVKYGLLHNHTENSLRDSAMSVERLVMEAKKLGAPALALTDHGVMTGYISFVHCCEENGIKPILGVEFYVEEENEGRKHLIVMAKNREGFQALIKAVSATSLRTFSGYPRANKELLLKFFGPGTTGHGNVIATSACAGGVLASIVLANRSVEEDIKALRDEQDNYTSPDSQSYKANLAKRDGLETAQKELAVQIAALKKAAAKGTKALLKQAETGKDEAKRMAARTAYEAAEKAKAEAAAKLEEAKALSEKNAADLKIIKSHITADEKEIAKWMQRERRIQTIQANHIDDHSLNDRLIKEGEWYDQLFGHGNFYIELQNHGIEMEKEVYPKLAWLSDWLDIPVVAANDAHIPDRKPDSVLARAIVQSTRFQYQRWYAPEPCDWEMYLKDDAELLESLCQIIPEDKAREAMENVGKITAACNFTLEQGSHYPKFVTPDGSTPEEYLRRLAYEGIPKRYPDGNFTAYDRLEHELSVICSMGYADYHCIVEDFLRYARVAGKLDLDNERERALALTFDTERIEKYTDGRVGEYVGPGRGSAAGSLVCYLIGITNIDPLAYGLLFERFLNPDRVSMPDIDCDIETGIRPYVIEYVKHKYGKDSVCGIMTKTSQKGKAALLTAAKTYALKQGQDSMHFIGLEKEIAKKAVELAGNELELNVGAIADDFTVTDTDKKTGEKIERKAEGLKTVFAKNKDALEIIHFAMCIEGAVTQFGQHAAGVIITDGHSVDNYVPLILSNKEIIMTSCDMGQAEGIGLLKMDFLGLKNLTVISNTVKAIYQDTGNAIDIDRIPMDDEAVYHEIFSKANTNSIFQFESNGMKNMLKGFKPESIFDLTLLVAMYRPGPMQFLGDVIEVKSGKKRAVYLTPELKPILQDTYGSITYQEQVQEIFRELAGYSLGQADLVRRAMSKKKEKLLKAEREAFIHGDPERGIAGCKANGISEEIANTIFDEVMDFSKYAFNKSHAACYAVVAYQTAWLKFHYPLQYMCSVLNSTDFDGIPKLCGDLNRMGITLKGPDVNISKQGFSIYDEKIYFGLGSIKGMGAATSYIEEERRMNGIYRSIGDFMKRTLPSAKIYDAFTKTGAFDQFCTNRKALMALSGEYSKRVTAVKYEQKKLATAEDGIKRDRSRKRLIEKLQKLEMVTADETVCDNPLGNLQEERDLLGSYVSGHPLDLYPAPGKFRASTANDILSYSNGSRIRIIGIIQNYREKNRKIDGKRMAFFDIADTSGTVPVCCFTKAYADYGDLLDEDAIVLIEGKVMSDDRDGQGEAEIKISADRVSEIQPEKDVILIYDSDPDTWQRITFDKIKPYISQDGNPSQVYFSLFGELRETDLKLNPVIIKDQAVPCTIQNMRL